MLSKTSIEALGMLPCRTDGIADVTGHSVGLLPDTVQQRALDPPGGSGDLSGL